MNSERKETHNAVLIILSVFGIILLADYLFYNDLIKLSDTIVSQTLYSFEAIISEYRFYLRMLLILMVLASNFLHPSVKLSRNVSKENRLKYLFLALFFVTLLLFGYCGFAFYDIFIFPIVVVVSFFLVAKTMALFRKNLKEDGSIFGYNQIKNGNCVFELQTLERPLYFPKGEYHFLIDGNTGCGKTASVIKPMIYDAAKTGYAGLIYDFNGDPRLKGCPMQTRTALLGLKHAPKEIITKFAFINFTDLSKSVRVNPLNKKYIRNDMDIKNMSIAMMKNLEHQWRERTDFWAGNAMSWVNAIALNYYRYYPKYCDLPHVIATCLSSHPAVIRWLLSSNDDQIIRTFKSIHTAYFTNAEGQIAGSVSSAQNPLARLDSPEIFWVLSGDDVSLDITNPEHPTMLCLGNSPSIRESISPVLSVISLCCMNLMNQPGRVKSIFCFDELPTVMLYDLDNFISTVRKFDCCVILALQDFEQLTRDYGEKNANTIRNNSNNILQGSTGNLKSAERFCNMLGDQKKSDISFSENLDSISTSERLQREKILQPRDVMSQRIGEFICKIAGGEPPFARVRFKPYEFEEKEFDIPDFSMPYNTGDKDKDHLILSRLVQENYLRINREVKQLLDPFEDKNDKIDG
jgi:hypothetical protein